MREQDQFAVVGQIGYTLCMEKRTGWKMACLSVAMLHAACERETEVKPEVPAEEKPAAETAKIEQEGSWEDAISIDVELSDDFAEQIEVARLDSLHAQRADLIVDGITGPVGFDMRMRKGPYRLADVAVGGTNTNGQANPITALSPPNLPTPIEPTQHLTLKGGAMGGRHDGDNIWAFNNVSDLHRDPFGAFRKGETAWITMVIDTLFSHGQFYDVGEISGLGDLRDTTLVNDKNSGNSVVRDPNDYPEVPTESRKIIDEQIQEQLGELILHPQNKRRDFKPAPQNQNLRE